MIKVSKHILIYFIFLYAVKLFADNDTKWLLDLENQAYTQAKNDTDLQDLVHNLSVQVKSQMQSMAIDDFNVNVTQNVSITNTNKTESASSAGLTLSPFVYGRFAGVLQKGTLLVFVSASVPYDTLRNIVERVDAINKLENKSLETKLVMRGVVGNNVSELKPTLNFIHSLLCGANDTLRIGEPLVARFNFDTEQQNCLQAEVDINPMLFGLFNVTVAPTVIYTTAGYEDITDMSRLIGTDANFVNASFDYWSFVGDLDLFYILEQVQHASK